MEIEKWLVLPDLHIPNHDTKSIKAVFNFAWSQYPWDGVVLLGDLFDFDYISVYTKGKPGLVEGKRFAKDFEIANKFLDELQEVTGARRIVLIEGNHDQRLERYLAVHPELRGELSVEKALRLKERGAEWVPYASTGKMFRKGKATFIHGIYTSDFHAKKHVEAYETNVFTGHLHDVQSYSKRAIGDNNVRIGQSLGCLCKYKPYYLMGMADRWQQAFGVFYFQKNGFFNYYIPALFNHAFVGPDGGYYDSK